jgi:RNase P subunit RPR2
MKDRMEEGGSKGLWHNIRAKRERGEAPARKGSEAYKKAVKAAKEIKAKSVDENKGSNALFTCKKCNKPVILNPPLSKRIGSDGAPMSKADALSIFKDGKGGMCSDCYIKNRHAMNESGMIHDNIYFKTFSEAVQFARADAEKKGYTIDEDDWFTRVNTGPGKPKVGETFSTTIGLLKDGKRLNKMLSIQVYGMKNSFELTNYIA